MKFALVALVALAPDAELKWDAYGPLTLEQCVTHQRILISDRTLGITSWDFALGRAVRTVTSFCQQFDNALIMPEVPK